MNGEPKRINPERNIARRKEDLPPLKEGYIRLVHLTNATAATEILKNGLDYSKYGMLQSTAQGWSNAADVQFSSDDPRFKGDWVVAVVLDMPFDEHRVHERIPAPGKVDSKYIVGIITNQKE